MTVKLDELGRRLKSAREAVGLRQEDVAQVLGFDRVNLSQIESGRRAPNSMQMARMSEMFGRSIDSLLSDSTDAGDQALTVLFRAAPSLATDSSLSDLVRQLANLFRETTNLESLLGIRTGAEHLPKYELGSPRNKADAIRQGAWLAEQERRRLNLGAAPILDMMEILEAEGVRTAAMGLPDGISGMMLSDKETGPGVVVNAKDPVVRRRFSLTHEYCHVLADRGNLGLVSHDKDSNPLETRANVFAAHFLVPEPGVRDVLDSVSAGKEIGVHHVVEVAHYFGVAYDTARFQLANLGTITRAKLDELGNAAHKNIGTKLLNQRGFDAFGDDGRTSGTTSPRRFISLACHAYSQDEISRGKARGLLQLAGVGKDLINELLDWYAPEHDGGSPVSVPD